MINYNTWDCKQQRVNLKTNNNQDATQALFYEFPHDYKDQAVYTLKNEDREYNNSIKVSAYQIYMHSTDEYEAAIKLVGSMKHWRKLCSLKWFREGMPEYSFEGLDSWRQDMKLRDESMAKKLLIESAQSGNVPAQKTLYGTKAPAKETKEPEAKADPTLESMVTDFTKRKQNG